MVIKQPWGIVWKPIGEWARWECEDSAFRGFELGSTQEYGLEVRRCLMVRLQRHHRLYLWSGS